MKLRKTKLNKLAKMIGMSVAQQSGFSMLELRNNIKVAHIKDMIIQHADADYHDVIEIDPDSLDDVCDDILNWLVGVKLCKLCGKDELDCFWDDKNDEMRFMFKDGKEFDWTKC